jgi:hypothetical protein
MKLTKLFAIFAVLFVAAGCGGGNTEKWVSLRPTIPYDEFEDWSKPQWNILDGSLSPVESESVISGEWTSVYLEGSEELSIPKFSNFVLRAQVLTEPGAASSLWFHRGRDAVKNEDILGYEIALTDTNSGTNRLQRGSLVGVRNIYKDMAADGEWYELEVAVRGKNITVKIDGTLVVDYVEPAEPYRIEEYTGRLSAGTFAITSLAGTTRIRDMKVLTLPDDATGRTDAVDETTDRVIRLQQAGFPVIDHHVHLKGWSQEQAMDNSRRTGIFYTIAPNCGIGFSITNDAEVANFIDTTRHVPALMAMQGEGREWPTTFSKASREMFDFVFTDALTFTDHAGRRVRLWIDDEVIIDVPEEEYMEQIVDAAVGVISEEPIDVYVNPFFLPTAMMDDYDALWTDERIARVVDALAEHGVALEVNARYRIPNARTIRAAMQAGVPLTFGTNNAVPEIGKLEYCFEMMDECGITAENMYWPNIY